MVKQGLLLKWGFVLLLLISSLSLAVQGAQPDVATTMVNNFDVFEADLRDVFRTLAEYGKINILLDKQVQGIVTTRFQSGMTVKQAIEILAQTNGYSFRWMMPQRTVLIGNENTFKNIDAQQSRIFNLKYADPETVSETLKVIIPKEQIGVDKRTNQLVVKANMLELQNIEEIVDRLDREMPQISIELRIEEVKRTALDEVGVVWDLDSQVSLDFRTPKITYLPGQKLKLWEEKSNAKLLSKPMVATTDSKEAVIFIGDRVPIAKTTTDAAGNSSTNIEYIDVGTKLYVTPRINNENIVTVSVKANLSNISGETTIDGNSVPVVRNRETGSVIRLKDGETFMLSGLNQVETNITESGIKGLGKIPLLGNLFKTKVNNNPENDSEIVIFITPKILKTEQNTIEPKKSSANAMKSTVNPTPVSNTPATPVMKTETAATSAKNESVPAQPAAQPAGAVAQIQNEQKTAPVSQGSGAPTATSKPLVPAAPVVPSVKPDQAQKTLPPMPANVVPTPVQPANNFAVESMRLNVRLKPGDNLSDLAVRYGISKDSIIKDNVLKDADSLKEGQELILTIPNDHLYRLQPKETLWRISKRYGVTMERLKEINNLEDVNQVMAGQMIILPVSVNQVVDSRF